MSATIRSLWAGTAAPYTPGAMLARDIRTDVAIVGAGFTGLSAALHLAEAGVETCVFDTHQPGWGASGRNGGQVLACHKYDPPDLLRIFGPERGRRLISFIGGAPDLVFDLIERHGIACDPVRQGWIQPAHNEAMIGELRRRAESWQQHGAPVEYLERGALADHLGTDAYLWGWLDRRAGGVNPLGFARGLAKVAEDKGARIYCGCDIRELSGKKGAFVLRTASGHRITASQVVIATNGYSGDLIPRLKRSIITPNSFQVATKPLPEDVRKSILPYGQVASDSRRLLNYFRVDASGRLLMGGRGRYNEPDNTKVFAHLVRAARRTFPQIGNTDFDHHWFGRVALTRDYHPHIHVPQPGVISALGYIGRGVALATATGRKVGEYLIENDPEVLPYPATDIQAIPFHELKRIYLSVVASYYRLRDRIG